MTSIDYSPEELKFMERNTIRLDTPVTPMNTTPPKPHPLAGTGKGVRSTSRKALKIATPTIGANQMEVLRVIQDSPRPINDRQIAKALDKPINKITNRRGELKDMGKVQLAGSWPDPETGIRVMHWKAAEAQS